MITRHFIRIPGNGTAPERTVHYRRCGTGPALLMVHQSPRSSAEYIPLMEKWGEHFTCIAPDTPGFGQSDPLPGDPKIDDFVDALAELIEALGIKGCAAYGFHSGAIILGGMFKRHADMCGCYSMGGYALWTDAERAMFAGPYLPPFEIKSYGEHLTWIWNRVLEETWFFPWFDVRDEAQLTLPHADPERVQYNVSMLLDSGAAYRAGYGAVLQAPRDVPPPDAVTPPVYISAYKADPLVVHIARLENMPANWVAEEVATAEVQNERNLAFLKREAPSVSWAALPETDDEGFVEVAGGLIHWRGTKGGSLRLHAPAAAMGEKADGVMTIDVPGHGLSDRFDDMEAAILAAAEALECPTIEWPDVPAGDPNLLYPDLTPDRFGNHLHRAWAPARAEALFCPWYDVAQANRVPVDPSAITPDAISARFLARLRAGASARQYHDCLLERQL